MMNKVEQIWYSSFVLFYPERIRIDHHRSCTMLTRKQQELLLFIHERSRKTASHPRSMK